MELVIGWRKIYKMIKKVRNQLSVLFTFTTGLIFTLALIGAVYFFHEQNRRNQWENFQTLFYNLVGMLQKDNSINIMDLAKLEDKNNLIIYMEDNNTPLSFEKLRALSTNQIRLIEQLKKYGEEDGIDINNPLISINELSSKIYQLYGENQEKYLGQIFITAKKQSHRSLLVIQQLKEDKKEKTKQYIFFIFLELAGMIALYTTCRYLVLKALKPVEESKRKQTEFIAAASHELRSPLAVVGANIAAIRADKEQMEYFFQGIEKECTRMSRLIDDMLLLASVDAKSWTMRQELFEVDTLLIEIYDFYYAYFKKHNMKLILELPEESLPKLQGDTERIRQVLGILLNNAISYGKVEDKKESYVVRLTCKQIGNKICLFVIDYGNGIEKEKQLEIFDRFYRVDRSRKDKKHFGLGLSIAKELIELHRGTLTVTDTDKGGCTFVIDLPIKKENHLEEN